MNKVHKKDVTDEEIERAMEPVFRELEHFLVLRVENPNEIEKSKNSVAKVTDKEIELLTNIYEKPNLAVTSRSINLGLSASDMNSLKTALLRNGFIEQFSINLGKKLGRNNKMLMLTAKGYKAIGKQAIKKPKNVSKEHWWWQTAIYEHLKNQGIETEIEKSKNKKRADIAIEYNGRLIAYEIELSPKNAIQNIAQDIKAGFDAVVSCCKNTIVMREVQKQFELFKDYESIKDKVKFRLLTDLEFVKNFQRK